MNKKTTAIALMSALILLGITTTALYVFKAAKRSQQKAYVLTVTHHHEAVVEKAARKAGQRVRMKEEELNRMGISGKEKQRRLDLEKQLAMAELKQTEASQKRITLKAMDKNQ